MGTPPFATVLVANRGEVAVRIIRTLRSLGIRSVAVFSDADRRARHVLDADEAVHLGPTPAAESYLRIDRVLGAAAATGADAVHPGYGFLAEHAGFARACIDAGLVFVGPPAAAIAAMGDKIRARATVAAAGVPVVPGTAPGTASDAALVAAAGDVGFPLLVKPSAGGGGKGMRLVREPADLPGQLASARREARAAFGDDTLFLERFVTRPRHVEVQVLLDHHGGAVHLGERECSLQRRHQKIVEEAPSPLLDDEHRRSIGALALAAAGACGYANAGTVELIVSADDPGSLYFLEMNTRLQVEHPVTEAVWDVDLVALQLQVAAGHRLPFTQDELHPTGHAVEARVYAEDPAAGFLPSTGTVAAVREPAGPGIRVDSALRPGLEVGTAYDPMLAKVVAWGPDRPTALRRLDAALADAAVVGVGTNLGFLRALLGHPDVVAGRLDTGLVERELAGLTGEGVPEAAVVAAALHGLLVAGPVASPWDDRSGWRTGGAAWVPWRAVVEGAAVSARTRAHGHGTYEVALGDAAPVQVEAHVEGDVVWVDLEGRRHRGLVHEAGGATWVTTGGTTWAFRPPEPRQPGGPAAGERGELTSPMPGTVVAVGAAVGEQVAPGQPVVAVEAMKMEHTLAAPFPAVVEEVRVVVGDPVALGTVLAVLRPLGGAAGTGGGPGSRAEGHTGS
jgi:acetyl-CoA/propionyl-CoA carboxylase, biotin carboxylase, biotin carboxyl carrier protein